jgi:hypothetical protein
MERQAKFTTFFVYRNVVNFGLGLSVKLRGIQNYVQNIWMHGLVNTVIQKETHLI